MPEAPRIARPGDVFILIVPTDDDLERLRNQHLELQNKYGGQVVEPIHITVERFSPEEGTFTEDCIPTIKECVAKLQPFPISADALIQFYAPYWQSFVLRWRVKETPIWNNFRDLLEDTLNEVHCPSHFTRRRHASCTILKLDKEINLPGHPLMVTQPLFMIQELWISLLREDHQFEILEKLELN